MGKRARAKHQHALRQLGVGPVGAIHELPLPDLGHRSSVLFFCDDSPLYLGSIRSVAPGML